MRKTLTTLFVAGALILTGCSSDGGDDAATDGSNKLLIATTVSPITSIASRIGGDRINIEGIVPEGTNSHTFEPAPQVAELLSTADLILVNGLKLEDPTIDLANANLKDGAEIVEIGTLSLPETDYLYDFSFPKEEGKPNPHLWTDPTYAIKYAEVIRDVLTERDPANADYYAANYETFATQVQALGDAVRLDQETVPAGNRKLLTYHDAYAYFAKNYGWTVIGAVQPNDFAEPTPSEVADLIRQVKNEQVPTIFGSEVFPSPILEEIGRATGARYEDSLRDDDLPGAPGDLEHSWLGLMKYNFATMIKGLGGTSTNIDAIDITSPIKDSAVYPQ